MVTKVLQNNAPSNFAFKSSELGGVQNSCVQKRYFFCGIGGSGMLPLALILKSWGYEISGSDRAHDQGRTQKKFDWIEKQGIALSPQDGSGLRKDVDALIISAAIESDVPEIKSATDLGIPIITRAQLLAQIFNSAKHSIAVAGTSGKSTTTGMIAWVLSKLELKPTVMNGASLLNFSQGKDNFSPCLCGEQDLFVAECDESDGSIVNYYPHIGVLNNISFDHLPIDELIPLFSRYLNQSHNCVLNLSNAPIAEFLRSEYKEKSITFGWQMTDADFNIVNYQMNGLNNWAMADIEFRDKDGSSDGTPVNISLRLSIPGRHNIENATAALATCSILGIDPVIAANILTSYKGVARRLQTVGTAHGITVIDDFAHNPDKIKATLSTLQEKSGRLLIVFQMHGYGPLKLMREDLINAFMSYMRRGSQAQAGDILYMPDVLYMGGTADKSYGAQNFVEDLNARLSESDLSKTPAYSQSLKQAVWIEKREDIIAALLAEAKFGDQVLIMGARDDSLTLFAHEILEQIAKNGLER